MRISLVLIVRDEEEALPRCLASVRDLVDECVVLDTGSTDDTVAVAQSFGARVFAQPWTDDFAAARNAAWAHATTDYVFWLDADDVLLPPDRERFRQLRATMDPAWTAVTMVYHYAFDDQGTPILRFRLPRLVKRRAGFQWVGRVHEYLEGPAPWGASDVVVTHQRTRSAGMRNLRIYEAMRSAGEPLTPRDRLYYANELADHQRWAEAMPLYDAIAEDAQYWVEDRLWALNKLAEGYEVAGNWLGMRRTVYRSFELDAPRPEACCRLGYDALQRGRPAEAIVWYDLAVRWPPRDTGGFRLEACATWLPHLQLAVCYDALGDGERAAYHNEQAARWRPDDPHVRHNRAYFQRRGVARSHPEGDGGR